MYVLMMTADGDSYAAHESLFARIRDSVVLPPTPAPR